MSFSILQTDGSGQTEPWLPFSLSARFAIAITGIAVSWWLASRQDVRKLVPLPTFYVRAGQIAPTLLESALGVIFYIWLIALAWEYRGRSGRTTAATTLAAVPDPIEASRSQKGKWILSLAFMLIGVVAFSPEILHFLWPSYTVEVSRFTRMAFDLLVLVGIFIQPSGKKTAASVTAGET